MEKKPIIYGPLERTLDDLQICYGSNGTIQGVSVSLIEELVLDFNGRKILVDMIEVPELKTPFMSVTKHTQAQILGYLLSEDQLKDLKNDVELLTYTVRDVLNINSVDDSLPTYDPLKSKYKLVFPIVDEMLMGKISSFVYDTMDPKPDIIRYDTYYFSVRK